jgi:NAD(P)-dependent dehydrogenase (short-subunit alcohol dehydrogenase family)
MSLAEAPRLVGSLTGKAAIVTGAGRGLGESIARLLASRGASVLLADINTEAGEAVASNIVAESGRALFSQHDVSKEDHWRAVVDLCVERFGRLDILVNNAGVVEFGPLESMTIEVFDRAMCVNVRGAFLGCKLVQPAMGAAGGGSIINISSVAGMFANMRGAGAYSTSKGAVRLLTKAAALDYSAYNIRVNSVHPGAILTPLTATALTNPDRRPIVLSRTPMGRPAEPIEIARVVAFLASDEASYMTGSEVVVDGGWSAC